MSVMTTATVSPWRLAVAVMVGVLAAAAVIFAVWRAGQPSDFECQTQLANYELRNLSRGEVDQSCW